MLSEIQNISDGQQKLILIMTESDKKETNSEMADESKYEGEVVSRIEFVKYKNESRRTIRKLSLEVQKLQARLRMKMLDLKDYE